MYSRGVHFFLWKVVVGVKRLVNLKFEEILYQYWV